VSSNCLSACSGGTEELADTRLKRVRNARRVALHAARQAARLSTTGSAIGFGEPAGTALVRVGVSSNCLSACSGRDRRACRHQTQTCTQCKLGCLCKAARQALRLSTTGLSDGDGEPAGIALTGCVSSDCLST